MYYKTDENGNYLGVKSETNQGWEFFSTTPLPVDIARVRNNNGVWVNADTEEEIIAFQKSTIALFHLYPELEGMNPKLLSLDNLEGIKRDSTLADKGLKGEKKYRKKNQLIWSSEKRYWFQEDGYDDGFRRITKLFYLDGSIADQWENFYQLSEDDKEFFKKQQRELIFEYFKSQQPDLFNLLYTFFKDDIDRYVMKGGSDLAAVLKDAATNHTVEIVRQTLSMKVSTQSGGTVTVLDGILFELV
jgi:hypothetical protein